jgi:1-acyl-sn-glycerol-3-phosphate acyltransferase
MKAVRTVLFIVIQAVSLAVWASLFMASAPFLNLRNRYQLAMRWPAFVIWLGRGLMGIRWTVQGAEHLQPHLQGMAILCSKHQSTWETFFLPSFMPRQLCFVFKKELLWVPFFGWAIRLLRMVHIDRSKGAEAYEHVAEQGRTQQALGRWFVFFPEGTRTPVGERRRYKTGAARLAFALQLPIIPVAHNAGYFWPRSGLQLQSGCVEVQIGPAMFPKDYDSPEQLMAAVESWIEEHVRVIV